MSVESVLVEWFVDDVIGGRDVPYARDEQHSSDGTHLSLPLGNAQILEQHHTVVEYKMEYT